MSPHLCPLCKGTGKDPFGYPTTAGFPDCPVCHGARILWSPDFSAPLPLQPFQASPWVNPAGPSMAHQS